LQISPEQSLPDTFSKALKYLKIEGHSLTALPEQCKLLRNLLTLDLTNNQLLSLDDGFVQYHPGLVHLNLAGNRISSLSTSLSTLPLQILELSRNCLTEVPSAIFQLENLRILCLNYNKIVTISSRIGRLQSLQTLSLLYNQIEVFPMELIQLKSLMNFNVAGNPLRMSLEENKRMAVTPFAFPSLLELSCRIYSRSFGENPEALNLLPENLKAVMLLSEKCSYCSAPILASFKTFVTLFDMSKDITTMSIHESYGTKIPVAHNLCSFSCVKKKFYKRSKKSL
jgi:Leucine-rich repeat (LRR) protein